MQVTFTVIVREVKVRALESLDKEYAVKLISGDSASEMLVRSPADAEVTVTIAWDDSGSN